MTLSLAEWQRWHSRAHAFGLEMVEVATRRAQEIGLPDEMLRMGFRRAAIELAEASMPAGHCMFRFDVSATYPPEHPLHVPVGRQKPGPRSR